MGLHRLFLGVLALAACSDPQQIVLSIDTTAGIPCEIDKLRVRAMSSGTATFERDLDDVRLPLVVKLEDETAQGSFNLEVSGLKGNTEVLRAAGRLTFGGAGDLAANVVLESSCTPDAVCELPDLTPFSAPAPPVTARFDCSANVRAYTAGAASEVFRDACTVPGTNAGMVLLGGARGAAQLPLSAEALAAFSFRFYGKPIRQIWAHEDGYISFSQTNPDAMNDLDPGSFDRDIRQVGVPPPPQSAMAFWDKLNLGPNGVCFALEGAGDTQKLRVTWSRTCQIMPCGTDELNFTVVLDENNQRISFTYGAMLTGNPSQALGAQATVGVVNNATGCVATECNQMGRCADGTPCGYTQVFSNMAQTGGVKNVQFEPIFDPN